MAYKDKEYRDMGLNSKHCADFRDYHEKQMQDPEFRKEYEKLQLQHRVAKVIAQKREAKSLSQKDLAKRAQTTQAVISRIESGTVSVGLLMLQRIADALESEIDIVLK